MIMQVKISKLKCYLTYTFPVAVQQVTPKLRAPNDDKYLLHIVSVGQEFKSGLSGQF